MTFNWTKEQETAIRCTGGNTLVSAAAGAGKTAVLVQRIVRLVLDREHPVDIDRLLVVTFTEAAAAEMRERIAQELELRMKEEDRPELARQILLLNGANISTLHSFCAGVIRRYFYLLDIDPGFRVADSQETVLLQQEVAEKMLELKLSRADEDFLRLAGKYGGLSASKGILSIILKIYSFAWSNPWPYRWLEKTAALYDIPAGEDGEEALERWLMPLRREMAMAADAASLELKAALKLCLEAGGPAEYGETLLDDMERVQFAKSCCGEPWPKLREAWLGMAFKRLPAAREADPELKEKVKKMRDRAKTLLKKAAQKYAVRGIEDYLKETGALLPEAGQWCSLVAEFARMYTNAKKERGILDYNDLEHYCLEILSGGEGSAEGGLSQAARELRSWYEHVLVDEYQDISPVQDAILQLVSRQGEKNPNLFMVGDVKQSIYRFRQAEPGLFLGKLKQYAAVEKQEADGRAISLSTNFRCRQNIVHAVNDLFRQLMCSQEAEITYDSAAELVYGAGYPGGGDDTVELHVFRRPAGISEDEDDYVDSIEKEGAWIAQRIAAMRSENFPVYDAKAGKMRPLEYRDIAILLRTTEGKANRLMEVLAAAGIPAYAELTSGYFSATEVQTVLSLLSVIDNPLQDIPLAAVLRSPLVGLNSEELAKIACCRTGPYFYDAVLAARSRFPELADKLDGFLAQLDTWRNIAQVKPLPELLTDIYNSTGFLGYVGALPDGRQRQANLWALFERAKAFTAFSRQGLFHFLRFIEGLIESGEDLGTAKAQGEREDVVRIMSIHRSKGLEFPVVFVCDLRKPFNRQDMSDKIILHREHGLGLLLSDSDNTFLYPSLQYNALSIKNGQEQLAEELRLLYVALTRAREKLILTAAVKDLDELKERVFKAALVENDGLPYALVSQARCMLDWIAMALARHPDAESFFRCQPVYHLAARSRWLLCDGEEWEDTSRALESASTSDGDVPLPMSREEALEKLSYVYPYAALSMVPAKMSVSELKGLLITEDTPPDALPWGEFSWNRPAFALGAQKVLPEERGNTYHRIMQNLDLGRKLDEAEVARQVRNMVENGIISEEDARLVEAGEIAAFFDTEPGRLAQSPGTRVFREWPFMYTLPVSAAGQAAGHEDEWTVVQGVVDLLLELPHGFMVVDYKTGRPDEKLISRYEEQVGLYALAASSILGKEVLGAYLWFFGEKKLAGVKVGDDKKFRIFTWKNRVFDDAGRISWRERDRKGANHAD